jgi:hypothetical protein
VRTRADAYRVSRIANPKDFQGLCGLFKMLLRGWSVCPLYLLLDSVDQLDDSNGGRRLQWLPVEADSLSPHVRLVISTLPDGESFGRKFQCLGYLRKRLRSTSRPFFSCPYPPFCPCRPSRWANIKPNL